MKRKYIKIYIDIPTEKVLQKHAVKALKDNHVRAFSRKLAETARKRSSTRKFSGLMCFKNKHKLKRLNETNIWHISLAQPIWAVFKLSLFNFFHKSMNVN